MSSTAAFTYALPASALGIAFSAGLIVASILGAPTAKPQRTPQCIPSRYSAAADGDIEQSAAAYYELIRQAALDNAPILLRCGKNPSIEVPVELHYSTD